MPPGKRVYGKAPRPQHESAARIFAESSSSPPVLHANTNSFVEPGVGRELPPPFIQAHTSRRKHDQHADVQSMVDMFDGLKVNPEDTCMQNSGQISNVTTPKQSAVMLRERDVNEVLDSPRSIRAKRRHEQRNQKSPETFPSHSNEDAEAIVNVKSSPKSRTETLQTSRPRRQKITKPRGISPIGEKSRAHDSIYQKYTTPLLKLSNKQTLPNSFQSWSDTLVQLFNVTKIAEASYGEVYRLNLKNKCTKAGIMVHKTEESVMKLIALKPPPELPDQPRSKVWKEKVAGMSNVDDVAGEVRLLRKMTPVPGFTNFRDVLVLQGRLPKPFVKAWKHYDNHVKKSLFPDPGHKATYCENQLWAMIEMQDAGQDLETITMDDAHMLWDSFWGVAIAVAKGEEYASFEHRDLHLGNVCINKGANMQLKIDTTKTMGFTSLETTLIDYTLSRARMNTNPLVSEYENSSQQEDIAHFDLSKDPVIFSGDETEDYQYAIYRYMRNAVLQGDPLKSATQLKPLGKAGKRISKATQQDVAVEQAAWKEFHPITNVIWLHFILYTLLEILESSISSTALARSQQVQKHHDTLLDRLLWLRDTLLSLQGISEGVLLTDEQVKLNSAGELVTWAVSVGWLCEDDVVGKGQSNGELTAELELSDTNQLPPVEENTAGQLLIKQKAKGDKKKRTKALR